ncbi:MAG: hypothetical protein NTZ23_05500 [Cyanobium sp. LacPavin_0920_WC12_MAG_63_22]|nr:hypothetical protein [Cyanobium sp. LacPavin_0920_WC12_MAG_63_22]
MEHNSRLVGNASAFGASAPGREPPPIDTDTLARTSRLRIGPHRLQLPVVAIDRVERPCAKPSFWPCSYGQLIQVLHEPG